MTDFNAIQETLVNLDEARLLQLVNDALEQGTPAGDILNKGLIAGMDIVGEKMENEDMFIPEVLMAAQAMGKGVEILKPLLGEEETSARGCAVIGTVKGDLHDIGKNFRIKRHHSIFFGGFSASSLKHPAIHQYSIILRGQKVH